MARNRFKLTTSEIMNLDIHELQAMTIPQLKGLTQNLIDTANKRLKRLDESGLSDYSYAAQKYKGHRFSVKDKNTATEVLNEFRMVKQFLHFRSSSVKTSRQAEKAAKGFEMQIQDKEPAFSDTGTVKSYSNFWDMFHKAQELGLFIPGTYSKEHFRDDLIKVYLDSDTEMKFYDKVAEVYNKIYSEESDDEEDDFFDM